MLQKYNTPYTQMFNYLQLDIRTFDRYLSESGDFLLSLQIFLSHMWKFRPILKSTVWGGNRIAAFKGHDSQTEQCEHIGESYELSGMPGYVSVVDGGLDDGLTLNELIHRLKADLLGHQNVARTGLEFPLLVKFLDAAQDLSIQVHPDDKKAQLFALSHGKSELWYTLHADSGSRLCAGFKTPLTKEEYIQAITDGSIEDKLNYMPVGKGDVFYIPGGTVHSLCRGCLVLEIQQPSDTTFRIYDYGRRDLDGNLRQLHTQEALEALDFGSTHSGRILYPDERETASGLLATRHFTVNRLALSYRHHRDYKDVDSFKVLVVTEGSVTIADSDSAYTAHQGDVFLLAAVERYVTFVPHGNAVIIETYI